MKIQSIQNNNINFNGILKIKNLKNRKKIVEKQTTIDLDRGLANAAFNSIQENKFSNFINVLQLLIGINIPKTKNLSENIKLKNFKNGYNIKVGNEYEITHLRDDIFVFE